jgi:hypothetical protein
MENKTKPKLSAGSERGVSALEFTIIAPLVFVLIFGMIEFGIFFYDKAMITKASREGTRAGIVFVPHQTLGDITTRVTAAVNYYLGDYLGMDPSPWPKLICFGSSTPNPDPPNVTIIPVSNGGNDKLRVEVRWTYDFLVLPNFKNLGWVDLDSTIDINAVSEMMLEANIG